MLVPLHFCSTIASISILCLVSKNRTLRFLGSAGDGAGLFAFSLDYTIIGGEKAFVSPFWVTCNLVGAKIFWEWFIAPICFFTNVWGNPQLQTNYFYPDGEPFGKIECFMIGVLNSNQIFNGSGAPIKLERPSKSNTSTGYNNILKQDFTLDIEKYNLHKPLYITEMNALSIFSVFIGMTSTITFIILWYGADIIDWAKSTNDDDQPEDVHDRLMKNYYHLSEYLTMSLLLLFILFTIIICEVIPFTIPYWASVLSILVGMLFTFVSGFMKALTGARVTNMLFAELIIGYILPGIFITYLLGNTITCSAFTSLSRNIQRQAVEILGDMKLAHYLHVPPLAMFTCQLYGLTVGYIVNTLSTFYVLDVMTEPKVFHDPAWLGIIYVRFVSYHAGIWGAIGPYRFFGSGTPYFSLYYGIIIGIFLPFIPWLLNKRFPSIVWHLLNPCLMFCNMGNYNINLRGRHYTSKYSNSVCNGFHFSALYFRLS
jgi:OPT family oligopeptide transporter